MNGLENVKILSLFNTARVSKLAVDGKLAIALGGEPSMTVTVVKYASLATISLDFNKAIASVISSICC